MKLRRRLSQVQVALDEPWGAQNFPKPTRCRIPDWILKGHIASDKLRKGRPMPLRGSPPLALSRLGKRVQRRFDVILQEHSYRR
jgi:hypothetical protein